jgi:CheY-like chemotaxis protein
MTNNNKSVSEGGMPPEDFVIQVKEVLEHLYDFPFLQRHPLAHHPQTREDEVGTEYTAETAARRLRQDLIAAIETLNPEGDVPPHAPQARLYHLLILHYVEGLTVQEAANESGISRRQAHRNLRRGERSVAEILWARRNTATAPGSSPTSSASTSPGPRATQLSSVREEMARLVTHTHPIEIYALLQEAQEAVKQQAEQQNVIFHTQNLSRKTIVSADQAMARQVLINALSHAVRQAQPGILQLALSTGTELITLTLRYTPKPELPDSPVVGRVILQLVERLSWTLAEEDLPDGDHLITLNMRVHSPTVLVIDDNEGLVKLLDDYLSGHACQVAAATSGREGLQLAQEVVPNAIVLDVMLPEMDGWEVLQRLRNNPQTSKIPVIICSVLDSPELAYSLGASLFLAKPVSRDDVLTALHEIGVV